MVRGSREHSQPKVTIRTGFEAKPCHLLSIIFRVGQRPSTIWKVGNNICHIEIYISTILYSEKYPMKFSILKVYQFFLSFFSFQQFQLCQLHQLSNRVQNVLLQYKAQFVTAWRNSLRRLRRVKLVLMDNMISFV